MKLSQAAGLVSLATVALAIASPATVQSATGSERSSEEIFETRCAYCHEAGGWGTRAIARRMPQGEAELLKRENLPPAFTTFVVRRGIGAMPQFTPTELTDAELAALAEWLENRN